MTCRRHACCRPAAPDHRAGHRLTRSRGATLVVSLVMLVLMSLIGVSVARIGLFDELGARGARDQHAAFEAADAALRDGELDLRLGLPPSAGAPAPVLTGVQAQRRTVLEAGGFVPGCGTGAALGLCVPSAPTERPVWQSAMADPDPSLPARRVAYGTFSGRTWPANPQVRTPTYVIEAMVFPLAGADATLPPVMYRITAEGRATLGQHTAAVQSVVLR